MSGSRRTNATIAHTSSSRSCASQPGIAVYFSPCRITQNVSSAVRPPRVSCRLGGTGSMRVTTGERGTPGAPWQGRQPVA